MRKAWLLLVALAAVLLAPLAGAGDARAELAWTVERSEWTEEIGFREVRYRSENAFLVVRLRVANRGDQVAAVPEPRLMDEAGRGYPASWKGWVLPMSHKGHQLLVPGSSRTYVFVFDVPREGRYRLLTKGGEELALEVDEVEPAV